MRLTRLATIELNRPAPTRLGRWTLRASNGVAVEVGLIQGAEDGTDTPADSVGLRFAWPYETTSARLAVSASLSVGPPIIEADGLVAVPDKERRRAESAIGEYGDLLSVNYQCRRVVRSPKPCIAVVGEDPGEIAVLADARGLKAPLSSPPRAVFLPAMGPNSPIGGLLVDRLDGLALLADALSEDGPVGQVHNMFRVFERAFRVGPAECVAPLLQLLNSGPVGPGWSEAELNDWFTRLRPELTHADRREAYARAADVAPYLGRIEYAAYDVLFNKANWRRPDAGRRNAVVLAAGLESDRKTLRLERPEVTIVFPWVDPFGVFPIDFNFRVRVSANALTKMPGYMDEEDGVFSSRVQIRRAFEPGTDIEMVEVATKHEVELSSTGAAG